jgi:hypothetical protein
MKTFLRWFSLAVLVLPLLIGCSSGGRNVELPKEKAPPPSKQDTVDLGTTPPMKTLPGR